MDLDVNHGIMKQVERDLELSGSLALKVRAEMLSELLLKLIPDWFIVCFQTLMLFLVATCKLCKKMFLPVL